MRESELEGERATQCAANFLRTSSWHARACAHIHAMAPKTHKVTKTEVVPLKNGRHRIDFELTTDTRIPRNSAARKRLKLSYSITSSARASRLAGMSTPSIRAVCALMTSSNVA